MQKTEQILTPNELQKAYSECGLENAVEVTINKVDGSKEHFKVHIHGGDDWKSFLKLDKGDTIMVKNNIVEPYRLLMGAYIKLYLATIEKSE